MSTRAIYPYLYDTLTQVDPLMDILDDQDGIRRMDQFNPQHGGDSETDFGGAAADERAYRNVLTMGRLTRSNVAGLENRPVFNVTVTFQPWLRGEESSGGDLLLEDVQDWVLKALVWTGGSSRPPNQSCVTDPGIVIMQARLDADTQVPVYNHEAQAWTKQFRMRFLISIGTCLPVAEPCTECR